MDEAIEDSGDSIQIVRQWLNEFLSNPHMELGRTGAVCPFVKPAMDQNMLTIRETDIAPEHGALESLLQEAKTQFLSAELGVDSSSLIYSSSVIILPRYTTPAHAQLMDEVHATLKIGFMFPISRG